MLRRMSLGLVVILSVVPFLVGPVASVLGNDNPLNGRTFIWDGARTILRERPITGYGYAAVWGRSDNTLLQHIPVTARGASTSAHNSIVNVATELGLPAALVACAPDSGSPSSSGTSGTSASSAQRPDSGWRRASWASKG